MSNLYRDSNKSFMSSHKTINQFKSLWSWFSFMTSVFYFEYHYCSRYFIQFQYKCYTINTKNIENVSKKETYKNNYTPLPYCIFKTNSINIKEKKVTIVY